MVKEERCVNKYLYKILILTLKIIPMLTALGYLLNTLLSYINIDIPWLSHLVGMSFLPWLYILGSSIVFRFCIYHRMFLYYVFVVDIINITDYYIGIPTSDFIILKIHLVITGIFLFLILYFYVKHRKELTSEDT